jgi:hypothetical protein
MKLLPVVFILLSISAQAAEKKAIVCPPRLSYCYEKPVYREPDPADVIAESNARMQIYRELDALRSGSTSYGLQYELNRSFLLRR